jgi:hypothetical protein
MGASRRESAAGSVETGALGVAFAAAGLATGVWADGGSAVGDGSGCISAVGAGVAAGAAGRWDANCVRAAANKDA